jgi:hypothetical protein
MAQYVSERRKRILEGSQRAQGIDNKKPAYVSERRKRILEGGSAKPPVNAAPVQKEPEQAAEPIPQRQNTPAYLSGSDYRDQLIQPEDLERSKEISDMVLRKSSGQPVDIRQTPANKINQQIRDAVGKAGITGLDLLGRPVNAVVNTMKESGNLKQPEYTNIDGKLYKTLNKEVESKKDLGGAFIRGITAQDRPEPLEMMYSKEQIKEMRQKDPVFTEIGNFTFGALADPTTYVGIGLLKTVAKKILGKVPLELTQKLANGTAKVSDVAKAANVTEDEVQRLLDNKMADAALKDAKPTEQWIERQSKKTAEAAPETPPAATVGSAKSEQIAEELRKAEPLKTVSQPEKVIALKKLRMAMKEGTPEHTAISDAIDRLERETVASETPPLSAQPTAKQTPSTVDKTLIDTRKSYENGDISQKDFIRTAWNETAKWVDGLRKTDKKQDTFEAYWKHGKDTDRGYARYIDKYFADMPETLQEFWGKQRVKDLETGEMLNGLEHGIRGGHVGQIRNYIDEIGDVENATRPASALPTEGKVNTPPTVETPPATSQGTLMTDRSVMNVGDKKVKAYQFENPEVKPYYQDYAQYILDNEYVPNEQLYRTTDVMQKLKADTGLQPAQVKDALERLVKNNGQENAAAAKRVEIAIDDMLTNGFTTSRGDKVPPIKDYIALKSKIEGADITPRPEQTLDDMPIPESSYAVPARNVAESVKLKSTDQIGIAGVNIREVKGKDGSIEQMLSPYGQAGKNADGTWTVQMTGKGDVSVNTEVEARTMIDSGMERTEVKTQVSKEMPKQVSLDEIGKAPTTAGEQKFVDEYTKRYLPDDEEGLSKTIADLERQKAKTEEETKMVPVDLQFFAEKEQKLLRINLQLFAANKKLEEVTSKLYENTIQKSKILTDAEKAQVPEGSFRYERKPEAETTAQAAERVNADIEKTKEELLAKDTFNDVDTDSAMMIAEHYRNIGRKTGDYSKMNEWFASIRPKATSTGRGSQAWAKWQNTPEGVVKRANDVIQEEFEKVKKTNPSKAGRIADDAKEVKKGVKQASDEATDQAVKELLPEDMLAKRIGNTLKIEVEKKMNPLNDMVNELFRVAKESPLPDAEKLYKRDPYTFLQQAIANKEKYADVWEKAKSIVEKKYSDDPTAMRILRDYFDKGIIPTYSQKTLNSSVNAAMKDLKIKMSDIVLKGEKQKALETLTQFLTDKTIATGDEAKLLAEKISARFDELFKEKATAILKQKLKIGAGKSSPTMQNLTELINAGAFSDEDLLNVIKAKYGIPTLSNEVTKKIVDLAEQYRGIEAKGFRNLLDRVEIASKIDFEIAKLRKPTLGERVASFNYIQQLFNTVTQIRNIVGNEALYRSERFMKYPASLIDWTKSKLTGADRMITFAKGFNPWDNMKSYWSDLAKGAKAGWQGYDLIRAETDKLIGSSKKFNGILNPLKYMESILGASLNGFDYAAYMRGTRESLYEMAALQAKNSGQKVTKEFVRKFLDNIETETLEMAEAQGKYLTLRNENTISDLLFGVKNYGNKIGIGENVVKKGVKTKEYGLGNVIMNYPQATGALLQMSIDYSPIGFLKGLVEVSRPILGKVGLVAKREGSNYVKIVETFSKAIVGTFGFTALGYRLYDLELITGKANEDNDYANLEKQMGRSEYALNVDGLVRYIASGFDKNEAKPKDGDRFYTYSWLQPVAASVSLGANIAQIKAERQTTGEAAMGLLNTAITSVEGALNTLTDQSVMTGFAKFTKGYDTRKNIEEIASGVVTGFTGTYVNQLRKLNDNVRRSTDGQTAVSRTINKIKNRIPGLSKDLPAIYGTDGEVQEMYQGGTNNVLNVLFNPGFVSKYKTSPGIDLVLQLYRDSAGEKKQFPRTVDGKTISYNGKDVRLTAEEIGELQKMIGLETIAMLNKKAMDPEFEKKSAESQIASIVSAMDDIGKRARNTLKNKIGKTELKNRLDKAN